jgi:hypothetical protein
VAQRISSSQWCLRPQDRSYPALAFYVFSCRISPENSGSVNNRRCKTCVYPALIREIFSRRGPLSSGVIMCLYGNFTVRLVTVCSQTKPLLVATFYRCDLLHCKKRFAIFPSPAGMSLTKLSLGGNIPTQGEFSDIPAGDGKIVKTFLQCVSPLSTFLSLWFDVGVLFNTVSLKCCR